MSSFVSWLDHSETDRRQMREILALFSDRGTVDDLGVGIVRDAISNTLFPGTSVIQTRARYFLFIPWTFRRFESSHPKQLLQKAHDFERGMIQTLKDSGEAAGVIGRIAGPSVKVLPSAIYWNGMSSYGIFTQPGLTQGGYGRRVASGLPPFNPEAELAERAFSYWNREIPDPPEGFHKREATTLSLTTEEASWLSERMTSSSRHGNDSLLTALVRSIVAGIAFEPGSEVWATPLPEGVTETTRRLLHHARHFSIVNQGSAYLYNLLLAEMRSPEDELTENTSVDRYRAGLSEWAESVATLDVGTWASELDELWDLIGLRSGRSERTRAFVGGWARLVADIGPFTLADNPNAREFIRQREFEHKRGQARLANPKRVSLWEGLAGTTLMSYRWPLVATLLGDIADGLGTDATATEVNDALA